MSRRFFRTFKVRLLVIAFLWALVAGRLIGAPATVDASTQLVTTSPGGPMTVYIVINPNDVPLNVQNVIAGPGTFNYSFWQTIPPYGSAINHLRDIPQIPTPFQGTLRVYANRPFSAKIVGFDNVDGRYSSFLPWVRR